MSVTEPPRDGREPEDLPVLRVLGSRVHKVENPDVLALMEQWIARRDGRCRFIVNTGFHGLWIAHREPEFQRIVNGCDLFSPDGIAAVWISRLQGDPLADRATSAELMKLFFRRAQEKGYRSFFYGNTDETLDALRRSLDRDYPGHEIVGTYSPPFRPLTPEEDEAVVEMINEARPDVLWVGLGLPKQERWIEAHRDRLDVPVAIGVGACFAFFAGTVKRAPLWMGRLGFEWLWRFFLEPRKLWRRSFVDGPQFMIHAGREALRIRRRRPRSPAHRTMEAPAPAPGGQAAAPPTHPAPRRRTASTRDDPVLQEPSR